MIERETTQGNMAGEVHIGPDATDAQMHAPLILQAVHDLSCSTNSCATAAVAIKHSFVCFRHRLHEVCENIIGKSALLVESFYQST